ncbi:hypothetical protein H2203_003898 [Taxawa tesnikishii (nom. ined.)]|nr:hypothetical protein H2203_003898 [Dothideales sp. JES 119]
MRAPKIPVLLEHWRETKHAHGCEDCLVSFSDPASLSRHLEGNQACPECHKHCASDQTLQEHRSTHRLKCLYCDDASFKTFSEVLGHVESGKCSSGATAFGMANTVAHIQAYDSMVYAMSPEVQNCITVFGYGPDELGRIYFCGGCTATFETLNELFIHLETDGARCKQNGNAGYLIQCFVDSLREKPYQDPGEL